MTRYINGLTGYDLTDAFCGFKGYRVDRLRILCLKEDGYGMPLELWIKASAAGLIVREMAVDLIYTDGGKRMLEGLNIKAQHADEMFDNLVMYMSHELHIRETYTKQKVEVPEWMR